MSKRMHKLYVIFAIAFVVMLVGTVSAADTEIFKQGQCVEITQGCSDCTYNNISAIIWNNSTIVLSDVAMSETAKTFWNYSNFCNTSSIGTYTVYGYGDEWGTQSIWIYDFEVTPSGFVNTLGFFIMILVLSLGIIILGFWMEDAYITMLGSFGLYFLGIYVLFYGIAGIRDPVTTWALGLIILGIAFYVSIRSGFEILGTK